MHAAAVADGIEAELRAVGTRERAEGSKAYLKSDLDFAGATAGQVRGAAKRAGADLDRPATLAVVDALWAPPVFERRLAAALLLESRPDVLEPADLRLLERLIRESGTWALVDVLAGSVAGQLLLRHPHAAGELDRWAADDDFWVRRSALLALLKPMKRAGLPLDRFLGYADAMLDEKEFFVRKAIGWVLREEGKRRPEEVVAWLAPRTHRASGVTLREAVKHLPPADKTALMAAYKDRRPLALAPMTLDDIEWNPEATGVGSLLMIERGLPRDEFGHPYQPLIWFTDASRLLGLVVDEDDHVLAWASQPDPRAEPTDPPGCQRVPEPIERAAREWWSEHGVASEPASPSPS